MHISEEVINDIKDGTFENKGQQRVSHRDSRRIREQRHWSGKIIKEIVEENSSS